MFCGSPPNQIKLLPFNTFFFGAKGCFYICIFTYGKPNGEWAVVNELNNVTGGQIDQAQQSDDDHTEQVEQSVSFLNDKWLQNNKSLPKFLWF